jgi:hypothetical protein
VGPTPVLELAGLRLDGACAGGVLTLTARSSVTSAGLRWHTVTDSDNVDADSVAAMSAGGAGEETIATSGGRALDLVYDTPAGAVVSVQASTTECGISGIASAAGP